MTESIGKKYYWLKLKDDFFEQDDIRMIEQIPSGKDYVIFYLKLLCRALKDGGVLRYKGVFPYTPEMLASITNTDIDTVIPAIEKFKQLNMVEVLDDGALFMLDIQNMLGQETLAAERMRKYRSKNSKNVTSLHQCSKMFGEIEIEKEIDIEIDNTLSSSDDKPSSFDYQSIVSLFNQTCKSLPSVRSLNNNRRKAIKSASDTLADTGGFEMVFQKVESSDFLTGRNGQWSGCGFDWILKPSNLTKIIEGNYDNRTKAIQSSIKSQHDYDEEF